MQIQVNGDRRELRDESRLSDLFKELSLAPERVAVEVNHQIVRRNEWPNTILKEGDRVEIVHFVGGGASSPRDLESFDSDQRTPLDSQPQRGCALQPRVAASGYPGITDEKVINRKAVAPFPQRIKNGATALRLWIHETLYSG